MARSKSKTGITAEVTADLHSCLRMMTIRQQGTAWRQALRRAANEIKRAAIQGFMAAGVKNAAKMRKAFRSKVYRGATGFVVAISAGRKFPNAYWRNRYGKERPIVLWTNTGTTNRRRTAANPHTGHAYSPLRGSAPRSSQKSGGGTYSTGSTPAALFMDKARARMPQILRQVNDYFTAAAQRAAAKTIKKHYGLR